MIYVFFKTKMNNHFLAEEFHGHMLIMKTKKTAIN